MALVSSFWLGCIGEEAGEQSSAHVTTAPFDDLALLYGAGPAETYRLAMGDLSGYAGENLLSFPEMDFCGVLRPLFSTPEGGAGAFKYLAYFEGRILPSGTVAGVNGHLGADGVYDLYHHQYAVFRYKGGGFVTDIASVGAGIYAGYGFGLHNGVLDWREWFGTGSISIGLPAIQDWASVSLACFKSGYDTNGDGWLDGLYEPPDGVFGCAFGANIAAAVPDPLPFDVSATLAYWTNDREQTAARARRDGATLVTEGGSGDVYVQFGAPGMSHWMAGVFTGQSILADGPIDVRRTPAAQAVALGILRDWGDDFEQACGGAQ